MFSLWKAARFSATAVVALCVAHEAMAQYGGGYRMNPRPQQGLQQQQPKKVAIKGATGTVAAVSRGALQIVIDGNPWVVQPEANCKIQVTGTADRAALKAGQFVRLLGEFDKQGNATAPVTQIEITTPLSPAAVGVFHQGAATGVAGGAQKTGGAGGRQKRGADEAGQFLVVGRLNSVNGDELVVTAANKTITVKLADAAQIGVNVSDYSIAQPGDQAAINGWFIQPGKAFANTLEIHLSKPVGGQKKAAATLSQPPAKE